MPDLAQELVDQRNGRAAVDVVVAVDHDLLTVRDGPLDPLDRLVHVLHQERIMQVGEVGLKEFFRLLYSVYASLYKQVAQHGRDPQSGSQHGYRRGVALWLHDPAFFYRHTIGYLYISTFNSSLKNCTTFVFTSSMRTSRPHSVAIDATPRSVNPQGLMRENHPRSVETLSASPCMVT